MSRRMARLERMLAAIQTKEVKETVKRDLEESRRVWSIRKEYEEFCLAAGLTPWAREEETSIENTKRYLTGVAEEVAKGGKIDDMRQAGEMIQRKEALEFFWRLELRRSERVLAPVPKVWAEQVLAHIDFLDAKYKTKEVIVIDD